MIQLLYNSSLKAFTVMLDLAFLKISLGHPSKFKSQNQLYLSATKYFIKINLILLFLKGIWKQKGGM